MPEILILLTVGIGNFTTFLMDNSFVGINNKGKKSARKNEHSLKISRLLQQQLRHFAINHV